ncbi:polyphosphate kinase [Gangjinia marincola]|uniref:Polyphosphate kinase n=1 Tax=Gangjinia marincola TaxID=578463 RepID=A0ABN1MDT3_9FLAO
MKEIQASAYKVKDSVHLDETPTLVDLGAGEEEIEQELKRVRKELGKWQDKLYAHGKYAVLVCLQGMDTAGKDSLIREVFKDFNVRGIVVHSFKVPTPLERKHDYLWRHYIALPARGKFGIFNRTHYENVLVTRVHPEYITGELLPDVNEVSDIDTEFWDKRFEQITNFERHIAENGTIIFKFYLHLSKAEQRNRLLRRLNKKSKNWKFSAGDLEERKFWNEYKKYYEDAINRTSFDHAPWYVIPADDKPTARLIVASILCNELRTYSDVQEPELDEETLENLHLYKEQLNKEKE